MSRRTSRNRFGILTLALLASTACNRVEIGGEIQKVRVYGNEDAGTAVVVDFRLTNKARIPLVVSEVEVIVETADGKVLTGSTVSDGDAARFLEIRPELGPKFNATLTGRTKLSSGQTQDYMVAASFEQPESEIQERKLVRVRVRDVDGPVFEFTR